MSHPPRRPLYIHLPSSLASAVSWVVHTVIIVPVSIVPPISWEVDGFTGPSEYRESKYENNNVRAAVHRSRKQVIVFSKESRLILAEIPLAKKADHEVTQDGTVDPHAKPTNVVGRDGGVEVPETSTREETVEEISWKRDDEANEEGERNPLVAFANREHVFGKSTPGDGLGIV